MKRNLSSIDNTFPPILLSLQKLSKTERYFEIVELSF